MTADLQRLNQIRKADVYKSGVHAGQDNLGMSPRGRVVHGDLFQELVQPSRGELT